MKTELEKRKLTVFLYALAVIALVINFYFAFSHGGFSPGPIVQPISQSQPPPIIWAAQTHPTRTKTVPADLSFAPDSDGSYEWVETIRPGDDLQVNMANNWTFSWDAGASSFVDVALMKQDGTYVFPVSGNNPPATALRFRVRPGVQQSADIKLKLIRPAGLADAASRKDDWPLAWKPKSSISVPNADAPVGTVIEEYLRPAGTFEIKLESPEYGLCLDDADAQNFYIKYGDDVSCWDYSPASKIDDNPPDIHGFLRARFQVRWLTYKDTRLRFVVRNKTKAGLFLTTGSTTAAAKSTSDEAQPAPVSVAPVQFGNLIVSFKSIQGLYNNEVEEAVTLAFQNTASNPIAVAIHAFPRIMSPIPSSLIASDGTEYYVKDMAGIRTAFNNPSDLTEIGPGETAQVSIRFKSNWGLSRKASSFKLQMELVVNQNYGSNNSSGYFRSNNASAPPGCKIENLIFDIPVAGSN